MPVEAELLAQQAGQVRAAERRGRVVDRRHPDVRGHDRLDARLDRGPEGDELARQERLAVDVDRRQLEVGVGAVSPCPGKCFAHAATPTAWSPVTNAAACRATSAGSEPNERTPMTGLSLVRVDVGDRSQVEVDAGRGELAADRRRHRSRQLDVVHRAEREVPGVGAARAGLEPGHVAALLVDPDQRVGASAGSPRSAPRAARGRSMFHEKRTTPPRPAASSRRTQSGGVGPGKPGKMQADGEPLEPAAHPLTAPAVSPKAILRCTIRKKITTGIAVSVEPAISPPQSVWRLVP